MTEKIKNVIVYSAMVASILMMAGCTPNDTESGDSKHVDNVMTSTSSSTSSAQEPVSAYDQLNKKEKEYCDLIVKYHNHLRRPSSAKVLQIVEQIDPENNERWIYYLIEDNIQTYKASYCVHADIFRTYNSNGGFKEEDFGTLGMVEYEVNYKLINKALKEIYEE